MSLESSKNCIKELGKIILETLHENKEEDQEVFERYTHLLRSKIHTHSGDFPERLCKGFEILFEETKT